jgi:signal transduction histidine kinase
VSAMMRSSVVPDVWIEGSGALVRTREGHITFWSRELEERYGFASEEAVGQVAHQLLRTVSWQALTEIEAELAHRSTWRGGLIHRRADGKPVLTGNYWHLHTEAHGPGPLVTELHHDIVPAGSPARSALADILATMAQELSEPLTAIGAYVSAAQRVLQPAWPDRTQASHAIHRATGQLARATATLGQMRALSTSLKRLQQRQLYDTLTATMEQADHSTRESLAAAVRTALPKTQREPLGAGLRRVEQPGQELCEHAVTLRNIQLFRRLLELDGPDALDPQTEGMVAQLLAQEEAKVAALGGR